MSSSFPAVSAEGLTKRFGDFTAVDGFDLSVETGTVVSLLGPNGAGKTTIVRMLATLTTPTAGSASVFGHDVVREADEVRNIISLTGQFAALEDNLTARENLVLMARLRGYRRQPARRVVDSLIDRFDIGEFSEQTVKSVSGGQRRRVDLAASLVTKPRLLVLDEPTSGLDPRSRQVVWTTIRQLVDEGVTLLLTTQYLEEADALADRVVLIDHGRTVAAGSSNELKALIEGAQRGPEGRWRCRRRRWLRPLAPGARARVRHHDFAREADRFDSGSSRGCRPERRHRSREARSSLGR
jgi:ABC-2 type transport system ATP-binding protein